MTLALREKADLFDRIQRQFRRSDRHRAQLAFEATMDEVARRGPPRPAAPAPAPPPVAAEPVDRADFDQALRDLLVRVHGRTSTRPRSVDPSAWWSNERVAGYRMWSVSQGGLWGARTQWTSAIKTAECLKGHAAGGTVPHLTDECGEPPCGIYAVKDADRLWRLARRQVLRTTTAVGVVELEGRVIEHADGYRAERARITRLCMFARRTGDVARFALLDDPAEIARMCRAPGTVALPLSRPDPGQAFTVARAWLAGG